jgi:hypothetical protein
MDEERNLGVRLSSRRDADGEGTQEQHPGDGGSGPAQGEDQTDEHGGGYRREQNRRLERRMSALQARAISHYAEHNRRRRDGKGGASGERRDNARDGHQHSLDAATPSHNGRQH